MEGESGMAPATYQRLVADAASGRFERACGEGEHDATRWHTLLNYPGDEQPGEDCHFDHHHGDNPHALNDIFGQPGAWFLRPGQSVSFPWQTFPAQTIQEQAARYPGLLENEYKHEGYLWIVRRNQPCVGGACVTDFRLQMHFHGAMDGAVGMHGVAFEGRVCDDAARPESCGIIRTGGWLDFGSLTRPASTEDCWTALQERGDAIRLPVPSDGLPYRWLDEDAPFDEFRCHKALSPAEVAAGPVQTRSGIATGPAEWWGHGASDFRFQSVFFDPIGNVNPDGGFTVFCGLDDPSCQWRHSQFTARIQYILPVSSYWFPDFGGQRVVNAQLGQYFLTRNGGRAVGCTMQTIGVDCIPYEYSNVVLRQPVGSGLPGFVHQPCNECQSLNHTVGRAEWVSYFMDHHP